MYIRAIKCVFLGCFFAFTKIKLLKVQPIVAVSASNMKIGGQNNMTEVDL